MTKPTMNAPLKPALAAAHLLNLQGERPTLMGSRCTACGEHYFPAARGCTRCGSTDLAPADLGSEGRLWSWTVQSFCPKPPYNGVDDELAFQPYGVGYIEMASGLKVESRLTLSDPDQLRIGMPMALTLEPYRQVPPDRAVFTFAFRPATPAQGGQP